MTAQNKRVATAETSCWVPSWPSLVLVSPKTGTKAWEKAPSANIRRSKLGSRKATLKASVHSEAPKVLAIKVSLKSPVIRDSMVRLLTLAAADNRFTTLVLQIFGGGGSLMADKI